MLKWLFQKTMDVETLSAKQSIKSDTTFIANCMNVAGLFEIQFWWYGCG